MRLIPSANLGDNLRSVRLDASFSEIQTHLILNQFSQLPVFDGDSHNYSEFRGSISWRSIAEAKLVNSEAGPADAVESPHVVDQSDSILDVTPWVLQHDYVYVRDEIGATIAGVVTLYDLVTFLRDRAFPYLLVGEIEARLRAAIDGPIPVTEITEIAPRRKRRINSVKDLSMTEYVAILDDGERWARMRWPVDRSTLIEAIKRARDFRNQLMHFKDVSRLDDEIQHLRNLISLLQKVAPAHATTFRMSHSDSENEKSADNVTPTYSAN